MPVVHDPATGQFARGGGSATAHSGGSGGFASSGGPGGDLKGSHGVSYPASSITKLAPGAESYTELRRTSEGMKLHKAPKAEAEVKVKAEVNGKEHVFHAKLSEGLTEFPGNTVAVKVAAKKTVNGKEHEYEEHVTVLKSKVYPPD